MLYPYHQYLTAFHIGYVNGHGTTQTHSGPGYTTTTTTQTGGTPSGPQTGTGEITFILTELYNNGLH